MEITINFKKFKDVVKYTKAFWKTGETDYLDLRRNKVFDSTIGLKYSSDAMYITEIVDTCYKFKGEKNLANNCKKVFETYGFTIIEEDENEKEQ